MLGLCITYCTTDYNNAAQEGRTQLRWVEQKKMREEGVATDALRLKATARLLGVHTDTPTHRHTSEKSLQQKQLVCWKEPNSKSPLTNISSSLAILPFVPFQHASLTTDAAEVISQQPTCNCTHAHTAFCCLVTFQKEESLTTTKQQKMQTGLQYCCPGWVYESSIYTIYCKNMHYALHV